MARDPKDFNQVRLLGTVLGEPYYARGYHPGSPFPWKRVEFRLRTSQWYLNHLGNEVIDDEVHFVVGWNLVFDEMRAMRPRIRRGDRVYLTGRLRTWTHRQGDEVRFALQVHIDHIMRCPSRATISWVRKYEREQRARKAAAAAEEAARGQ